MSTNHRDIPWPDPNHLSNREKVPPEELEAYRGQFVAWSWDGSRIVGSDPDEETLWDKLEASGINPHRVVFSYVGDI